MNPRQSIEVMWSDAVNIAIVEAGERLREDRLSALPDEYTSVYHEEWTEAGLCQRREDVLWPLGQLLEDDCLWEVASDYDGSCTLLAHFKKWANIVISCWRGQDPILNIIVKKLQSGYYFALCV